MIAPSATKGNQMQIYSTKTLYLGDVVSVYEKRRKGVSILIGHGEVTAVVSDTLFCITSELNGDYNKPYRLNYFTFAQKEVI
jgi:hypothetical protein